MSVGSLWLDAPVFWYFAVNPGFSFDGGLPEHAGQNQISHRLR